MVSDLGIIMREFKNIKASKEQLSDEEKQARKRVAQSYRNFFEELQQENNEFFTQVGYPIHQTFSLACEPNLDTKND